MKKLFENWRGDLNEEELASVVLYFHGRGGVDIDLLQKRFPDKIVLVPRFEGDPEDGVVKKDYLENELASRGISDVHTIDVYGFSAGGKPMSEFILRAGEILNKITSVSYLDAIYGYSYKAHEVLKLPQLCGKVNIFTQTKGKVFRLVQKFYKDQSLRKCFNWIKVDQKHNSFKIPPR